MKTSISNGAWIWIAIACLAFGESASKAAELFKAGQFAVTLQEDNVLLPASIRWLKGDVELLKPEVGLNASFTSFEFRNKIYHEENRGIWAGKNEPRFITDAKVISKEACEEGEYTGVRVNLESSYARFSRTLLFHRTEPRLQIVYSFECTRDVMVYETEHLRIGFQFGPGFDQVTVCDGRGQGEGYLTATGVTGITHSATLLEAGPKLLTDTTKKICLLITTSASGPGLENPPPSMLLLKKGQKFSLTTECALGPQHAPALLQQMADARTKLDPTHRAYLLVENADILERQGKLKEAESVLLQAAELRLDYATPFMRLAEVRRDHNLPGQPEAFVEAGYRMPYNFGYMLSGSGYADAPAATEEQKRLHTLNLLMAVENTAFYPDYYLWAARGFLKMNMVVQACAMYRQALWAADFMPRGEETRAKFKTQCQKKIAELETIMRNQICTNLPPLIPVRIPAREP
ncbi:MAG: hypothetical protein PCFJNLEI_00563 [Verrucomicrobiae bacterium]|nr:hypothetical protein [Verrucomicrobiae bacterium]